MNAPATAVRHGRPGGAGLARGGEPLGLGTRAAVQLMLLPLRVLATTRLGRQLAAVALLMVVLGSVVSALYDSADGPGAASATRSLAAAAAAPGERASAVQRTTSGAPARQVGARPEQVAAEWFARRQGVARDKVQALQQQRVSGSETRVLVMADAGGGRMPTAYVTVKLGRSGWAVS
jgi:hypothetical protein